MIYGLHNFIFFNEILLKDVGNNKYKAPWAHQQGNVFFFSEQPFNQEILLRLIFKEFMTKTSTL